MKYLLDTNSLSNELLNKIVDRKDLYVMRAALEENTSLQNKENEILIAGIEIVETTKEILEKLKLVLKDQKGNFKLISLYPGKGTADVLMLAHILSERDVITLFPSEPWTLVTDDSPLRSVADYYSIPTLTNIDFLHLISNS